MLKPNGTITGPELSLYVPSSLPGNGIGVNPLIDESGTTALPAARAVVALTAPIVPAVAITTQATANVTMFLRVDPIGSPF